MSLHLYKPLGDNDHAIRLDAAKTLTSELLQLLSSEHSEKSKSSLDYALGRLTKGLASGRESARPGFAVVLTEFLGHILETGNAAKWGFELAGVIKLVVANTQPPGHTTGPEERDYHLGRLFGLKALVQSGVLFRGVEGEGYAEVLNLLFELSLQKPWLRESCASVVCSAVSGWSGEAKQWAAKVTYDALAESELAKTSDGTAVWLTLQAYCPNILPPKNLWVKECPLAKPNLVTLAKVLKEAGSKDEEGRNLQQKGSWNPKLNFVWDLVLEAYIGESKEWVGFRERETSVMPMWEEFWKVAVDESLFSASSSNHRKFWGFLIFGKALNQIFVFSDGGSYLAPMFSKNFMRCLINQLSDPERYLHKAAQKCIRTLLQKAESTPWTAPVIFAQLVSNNGTPNFDSLTKTKYVDKIMILADEDGLDAIIGGFRKILLDPLQPKWNSDLGEESRQQKTKTAEVRRQWAADQILTLIRNGKSVKAESWIGNAVSLLAGFGFLETPVRGAELGIPVSPASQLMFRSRLMSCLSHLLSTKDDISGNETWPYRAVKKTLNNKETLTIELDDTIETAIKSAQSTLKKINKKRTSARKSDKTKRATQLESFELLYSLVILQILSGEPDALEVLDELSLCYERVIKKRKHATEDEVEVSEVLIEILLSFLSKPSVLLRKLAQQVFTAFVDSVTDAGLELLTNVLETKESLSGQQELFGGVDEDEDGEVMDDGTDDAEEVNFSTEDKDELDSDVEIISASSSQEDEAATGTDDDEATKLETALTHALAPHAPKVDSDSDMSDGAMLALDETLSKIFRQRTKPLPTSKKRSVAAAKQNITNFKVRVLDLLEIFAKADNEQRGEVRHDPGVLLLPLLACIRKTSDRVVAERCFGVLKICLRNPPRFHPPSSLGGEGRLWALLKEVHELAELGSGSAGGDRYAKACSTASLVLGKTLVGGRSEVAQEGEFEERVRGIVGVYAETLTKWVVEGGGAGVQRAFFVEFVDWVAGKGKGKRGKGKKGV
ncbi:DNA polymerase phi-domain-containing protein [Tuber indicum]|nr:DNA polymerase phi-domain-containing protein [Tuber indicum]